MVATMPAQLYTPAILSLAVELASYPVDPAFDLVGEARSRSCGSTIAFACTPDDTGRVEAFGLKVTACAIGQAAAAIFAGDAAGRSLAEIESASGQIEAWLDGVGAQPDWPRIAMLEPAREHPGRHGAILLPWKAAIRALSNSAAPR
ncbi:MAG: iron-sulfur cluster assembly scaffold protein [Altererythrobacter sp.]